MFHNLCLKSGKVNHNCMFEKQDQSINKIKIIKNSYLVYFDGII